MLPKFQPLNPVKQPTPFDDPDWLFEVKFDGFRALAYIEDGRCELVSRKRHVYSRFAELKVSIAAEVKAKTAILDGEIVCLNDEGYSDFNSLMSRRKQPFFYAFDFLWSGSKDLRDVPLIQRKARLRLAIPTAPGGLLYLDHIEGEGVDLYDVGCGLDLEGIVAKPKAGPYRLLPNGKSPWIKVKNPNYSQAEGRAELFNARRGSGGA